MKNLTIEQLAQNLFISKKEQDSNNDNLRKDLDLDVYILDLEKELESRETVNVYQFKTDDPDFVFINVYAKTIKLATHYFLQYHRQNWAAKTYEKIGEIATNFHRTHDGAIYDAKGGGYMGYFGK